MLLRAASDHSYITNGLGLLGGVLAYRAFSRAQLFSPLGRVVVGATLPVATLVATVAGRPGPVELMKRAFQEALDELDPSFAAYAAHAQWSETGVVLNCPGGDDCNVSLRVGVAELQGDGWAARLGPRLTDLQRRTTEQHLIIECLSRLQDAGAIVKQAPDARSRTTVLETVEGREIVLSNGELINIRTECDARRRLGLSDAG